ncbi:MAG TPA: thermonuclease family protein [Brevundimonas sp.]|jgi:endonuclease YncB( thermonuclease family)|uniref:thermonuclease family protein n=1 Tax=Brevundimonas sp. TaxID=1871086 RepID=UPI002CCAC35D|nr:thermonuclease family protein [Brevundimonas sp.]HRH21132.1 thermonuclease family protein [Brevundimonas sp.]
MGKATRIRARRLSRLEIGLIGVAFVAVAVIVSPLSIQGPGPARAAAVETRAPTTAALTGPATASDGDGLRLNGERIRLQGVDAFELHQTCGTGPCGRAAKDALDRLIAGRHVACEPVDTDRYGRTIAYCFVDGIDLGEQMVLQGHALAFRRYSTEYVDEEATARRNRAGAWAGTFENPADWRRANPRG